MKECYLCGQRSIVWDEDTDVDEDNAVNPEEVGILHQYHCLNCGARVSVFEERKGDIDELFNTDKTKQYG